MTALQPPAGFIDTPNPPVAGPGRLVSRIEEITINLPLLYGLGDFPYAVWMRGSLVRTRVIAEGRVA